MRNLSRKQAATRSLVGSSPTASARSEKRAHGPTGRRQLRTLRIRVQLPVSPLKKQSRGPTATTLGSHPGNDGSTPSGTIFNSMSAVEFDGQRPGMPIGRAAQLKPERLQVRILLWALTERRSGSVGNGRPLWLRTRDAVGSSPT